MIKIAKSSRGDPRLRGGRGKRVIGCGFIALGCFVLFMATSIFIMFRPVEPERGYNVDSVEWLPNEASDISYYAREGFAMVRIAEGSMSEADFRAWADANGWKLEERRNVRGGYLSSTLPDFPTHDDPDSLPKDFVEEGLFYENRAPNGGGVTVLFDREKERFHYSASSR